MAKQVLSLGAGVQSTTVLLMSMQGIFPPLDGVIFADTGWEPRGVYKTLDWLESICPYPFFRVSCGENIRDNELASSRGEGSSLIPYFVPANNKAGRGMQRRQCTSFYKIAPIRRAIREHILKVPSNKKPPREAVIDQWIGISADEVHRVKDSRVKWIRNVYPLCNLPFAFGNRRWTRYACEKWLIENYPDHHVAKSACLCCPYHDDAWWAEIRKTDEYAEVVEFEREMQRNQSVYLHQSLHSLDVLELNGDGDGDGAFASECEGLCGV